MDVEAEGKEGAVKDSRDDEEGKELSERKGWSVFDKEAEGGRRRSKRKGGGVPDDGAGGGTTKG